MPIYRAEVPKKSSIKTVSQPIKKTPPNVVKIQVPWYAKILIWFFIAFIYYLLFRVLVALFSYHQYIQWWNKNGGNVYSKIFSMQAFAFYFNSQWFYYVYIAGKSQNVNIPNGGMGNFIMGLIRANAKGVAPNGIVTPQTICGTIVPDSYLDGTGNTYPTNDSDWRTLFCQWIGISSSDLSSPTTYETSIRNTPNSYQNWSNNVNNFLWAWWAIPPDSLLMVAYMTQQDDPANNYNEQYMQRLLGTVMPGNLTGWWGLCKNFAGGDADQMQSCVWTQQNPLISGNGNAGSSSSCSTASNALSTFGSMSSGAMALGGALSFFPPYGTLAGSVIGASAGLALNAFSNKQKCGSYF